MPSIEPLLTIKAQLAAASQQWPTLQHDIAFSHDRRAQGGSLEEPPELKLHKVLAYHGSVLRGAQLRGGMIEPSVLSTSRLSSCNVQAAVGGANRFLDLSAAFWNVVSYYWPHVVADLTCPYREDSDAGVARDAWLGDYWFFFEREKALQQIETIRENNTNLDVEQFYVPTKDEWRLVEMLDPSPTLLGVMLLHNLAWLGENQGPLKVERYTWTNSSTVNFSSITDLRAYSENPPGPLLSVSLPLRRFASKIIGDPFLAMMWAIDDILKRIEVLQPPASPVEPIVWDRLDDNQFERLMYSIFVTAPDYEGVNWSTKTNAADAGCDMRVIRVTQDSLGDPRRQHIVVQCKHWTRKSVNPTHLGDLISHLPLWEPPRVDEVIVATSGHFSKSAIEWIAKHNAEAKRPYISNWARSDLERIVSQQPSLRRLLE